VNSESVCTIRSVVDELTVFGNESERPGDGSVPEEEGFAPDSTDIGVRLDVVEVTVYSPRSTTVARLPKASFQYSFTLLSGSVVVVFQR
jgi:hypothetical protein